MYGYAQDKHQKKAPHFSTQNSKLKTFHPQVKSLLYPCHEKMERKQQHLEIYSRAQLRRTPLCIHTDATATYRCLWNLTAMCSLAESNVYNSEERLFSGPSLKPSFVRFLNRTQRSVDVIWINYDGLRVKYKTLGPYEYFDVNTFVNHPWIFRDTESFDKMVVCNKDVFHPEPWDKASSDGVPSSPQRRLVCITIPVYRLKDRCFQIIRHYLRSKDAIFEADIPLVLKKEFFSYAQQAADRK